MCKICCVEFDIVYLGILRYNERGYSRQIQRDRDYLKERIYQAERATDKMRERERERQNIKKRYVT